MPKAALWKRLLPWRKNGYKVLDRYSADEPVSGDALVLQHMVARGADLSKPRHVVHYLYFANDEARDTVESQLRLKGYGTLHGVEAPGDLPKSLIADRHGIVNVDEARKERELLEALVDEVQGEYDGWEAQLD